MFLKVACVVDALFLGGGGGGGGGRDIEDARTRGGEMRCNRRLRLLRRLSLLGGIADE